MASPLPLPYQTGFGCDKQDFLVKNTVYLHVLKTGDFAALSDVWFETIWQQHMLYWPPLDHCQHVRYALQWLFDTLDPDTCSQAIATMNFERPTAKEIAKSNAVKACKSSMAVLCNPKAKLKQHHIGWNSHSIELYADLTNTAPAHHRHHHHSWSFAGPSMYSSSVKHGFILKLMPLPWLVTLKTSQQPLDGIFAYACMDDYIAESLRREGCRDAISQNYCTVLACEDADCPFHCITCRDGRLFCHACIISIHVARLTHVIQCWNSNYFDKVPLHELSLRYQVGHLAGELQASWLFPVTDTEPHTTVTTAALEQFQMLTFMGKISAYEAGIGNELGGWKAAKPGSCAVECLACPCPGVNIPEHVDPGGPNAWENTLYIGMDVNFRLERFNVLSEDKEPGLSKGLAYFVDTKMFRKHLKDFDKRIIQPPSSCSNHEATKGDKGSCIRTRDLAASGVGGMWIYMLVYLVPKFHLPGHIKDCQERYCMSFHIHVGKNDGEAPERSWAISNGVAASTREMGPGHRHEKLDQHFGDFNWQKNVSQGDTLFSDVAKWTEMVEAWEVDRNKPNPFAQTVASKTEAVMHLQLAQEDAQDEMAGLNGDTLHTTSLKGMISQGIQLESSQWRISHLNKELGAHSMDLQRVQSKKHTYQQFKHYKSKIIKVMAHHFLLICFLSTFHLQSYQLIPATRACQLLSLSKAYKDGDTNVLTQKERLKCHKTTWDLNARITQVKQYYCDIIKWLTVVSTELGEWGWQAQLRVLEDSDVHRIADDEVGISEGNRTMSWIWYSSHLGDMPEGVQESHQWHEECKLLKVKMEHVKCTLEHDTNLWLSHAKSCAKGAALINAGEGAGAYAKRQAAIWKSIRLSFEEKWHFVEQWLELGEMDEASNEDVFTME
ncbi:hypothetical protein EDD18DRAFT_1100491 [Armillaria luteobubalina]|uniref:CxC2-like cysteine cluster KDZ transposase-associated domain-containing protein n=1 Tax=Armillaria luteobubalina TaxID=153913 RepID=A0AA39QHK6_9AGAR|nr:hypothetical protein EDD18DRAFT_1100491 [Armillaria luteobubalina]